MALEDMCRQTITIKKPTLATGSMGGETRTFAVRSGLSGIAASIQNHGSSLVEMFNRRGLKVSNAIYTAVDISAAQLGDIIEDVDSGENYLVENVADMAAQERGWAAAVNWIPPTQ